jgi:hypothetical protein
MKTATAKKMESGLTKTVIDPTLEEKLGNRVLFPEKLARANEDLKKYGLPKEGQWTK